MKMQFCQKERIVVILWNNFLNWLIKWLYKLDDLIALNYSKKKKEIYSLKDRYMLDWWWLIVCVVARDRAMEVGRKHERGWQKERSNIAVERKKKQEHVFIHFTPSILIESGFCPSYFKTRNFYPLCFTFFTPSVLRFLGFYPLILK